MSGLLGFIPSLHLPVEESAPSDGQLLLWASLPAYLLTLGLHLLGVSLLFRLGLSIVLALLIRYSPWFRRPEGVMLNILVGWLAGEIINLLLWH